MILKKILLCSALVMSLSSLAFPASGSAQERAGAVGAAVVARAESQGVVRVIVGLRDQLADEGQIGAAAASAQRARLLASQQAVLGALGGRGVSGVALFETIPYLALNADAAAVRRLLADPRVASVQEDVPVPPTLTQSVPLIKADQAATLGFPGTGQVVAVLDTGVAKSHAMFAGGKVVSEACYSSTVAGQSRSVCPGGVASSIAAGSGVNCPTSVSGCNHGTHVAAIAAGSSASLRGVARGAKVLAIQIFSRFDSAAFCGLGPRPCVLSYTSDQIKGLERVYALRATYKIAAVNMSLGGGLFAANCDSSNLATKAVIDRLRAARIATVIASGNNGVNGYVSAPACISTAVTVGSTTKTDQVSSFSNHAPLVELMAPGSSILAAVPGGTAVLSGTSMATPHVAGAWAILMQAKPTATVPEVLQALACTGKATARGGVSKPRIDVLKAVNVLRSPAPGCA
jgi:subtilisin family serine protease